MLSRSLIQGCGFDCFVDLLPVSRVRIDPCVYFHRVVEGKSNLSRGNMRALSIHIHMAAWYVALLVWPLTFCQSRKGTGSSRESQCMVGLFGEMNLNKLGIEGLCDNGFQFKEYLPHLVKCLAHFKSFYICFTFILFQDSSEPRSGFVCFYFTM